MRLKAVAFEMTKLVGAVTYFVRQGVGLIDGVKPVARVVQDFKEDFAEAMSTVMAWSE